MTPRFARLPLKIVLIIPFVVQMGVTVGLVGYLSYQNGQQAVEDLANQLMEEVSKRISDRLDNYLKTAQHVVATNHLAWQQKTLDIKNWENVKQQLWQQTNLNPSLSSVYFLNARGENLIYGRILSENMRAVARQVSGEDLPLGTIYYAEARNPNPTQRNFYLANTQGKPQKLFYSMKMNFRALAWYKQAKANPNIAWTPLSAYQAAPMMGIFAVAPLYDRANQLQGVFAADVAVADISSFLHALHFSPSGQAMILDHEGQLVATSTLEPTYTQSENHPLTPLSIFHSQDVRTREIAQHLQKRFGNFHNLQTPQQLSLRSQGERVFVKVVPYRDQWGLDWLVVVAIPESDFMAQIYENTRLMILLCLGALGGSIGVAIFIANKTTQPIRQLSQASQAMARGNLDQRLTGNLAIDELNRLSESFNSMAQQLSISFDQITTALQESEEKFTKVFRVSPDPIAITTLEDGGRYLEVNDSFLEFSEYSREEVIGRTAFDLNLSTDLQQNVAIAEQLHTQGTVKGFEFNYRTKSGKLGTTLLSLEIIELDGQPRVLTICKDISERKHIEEALRQSESKLKEAQHIAQVGSWELDVTTRRSSWSEELFRILGLTPEQPEPVYPELLEMIHPDDRALLQDAVEAAIATGKSYQVEHRIIRPDGSIRYIVSRGQAVLNDQQQVIKLVGTGADITERKHLEIALEEKNAELERFFNVALDLLCIADTDGYFRRLNPEWENRLGYSLAELEGHRFLDFVHPDDLDATLCAIAELSEQRPIFNFTNRYRHRNGFYLWIEWRSLPIGNMIYAAARDITDRQLAEIALRESEEKFSTIFQASPDPLWIATLAEGRCLDVNTSFVQFLGYSYSEIIGKTCVQLELWNNIDDLHYFRQMLMTEGSLQNFEVVVRTRSKEARTVLLSAQVSILSNQACVIGLLKDISDRKQIEEALARESFRSKTLLESSVDGIVVLDQQGNVLEANASFARMIGYSLEETQRLHLADWEANWTGEEISEKIAEVKLCSNTFESRHRRKDGSIYDVEISANPVSWDGQIVQFCICRDITERKQLELAIKASEAKLNDILNNAVAAITSMRVFADGNWEIEHIAAGCQVISGYSPEELKADKNLWIRTIVPEDWQAVQGQIFEDIFAQRTGTYEYRIYHKDGRVRWISQTNCSRWDEGLNCWIVTIISLEITERKHLQLALQTSECRLRSVLNNAPAFISGVRLIDNEQWEYEYFSPGSEAICGYTGEEIATDPQLLLSLILPEDLETVVKPTLQQILMPNFSTTIEYRLRHRNGQIRYCANSLSSRWDEVTQSWYATGIMIDITERKQAEEALQQLEFRLQHLAAASPGVIYTVVEEPQGPIRYEYISPAFEGIHEIPVAEVLKNPEVVFNQIHPEDRAAYQQAVEQASEAMQLFRHEWRIITPSGRMKWIQAHSRPERRQNGEMVWHGIVLDVSNRKQAEEALRQSQTALLEAQRIAHLGSWSFDVLTQDIAWSEEMFRIFGRDPLQGPPNYDELLQYTHPDDLELLLRNIDRAITEGRNYEMEIRILRPDGTLRYTFGKGQVMINRSGQVVKMFGIVQDITERKQAEETLRITLTRLQNLATAIPGNIYSLVHDPDGAFKFEYSNRGIEEITEFTREQAFEDPEQVTVNLIHPDDQPGYLAAVAHSLQTLEIFQHEWRIITPSGKLKWLQGNSQPERRDNGDIVWHGIVQDITERKQAEEALRITSTRLQNLATAVPGVLYSLVLHEDGTMAFEYINRAFEQIHEVSLEAVLAEGQTIILNQMHPEDQPGYLEAVARSRDTLELFYYEWRIITPSGKIKWLQGNSQPERRENGDVCWHGIVIDISDRKQTEAELQRAKEAAESANVAKSAFLANMSHELRTPLNAILGFAQLMSRNRQLPPDYQENLAIINRSGEHLLSLINDVLDMAKIEAGCASLNEQSFNLYYLLDELIKMFDLKAREKGLKLNFFIAETVPELIEADKIKLRQVLINLVSNSIKFTDTGSVTLRVSKRKEETGYRIQDTGDRRKDLLISNPKSKIQNPKSFCELSFEVEDTGVGIAESELKQIFEPFIQSRTGKKVQEGTGLGLPISQNFVELMGGEMTVESQIGQGSIFNFYIQVRVTENSDIKGCQSLPRRVIALEENQPNYKILIADDQADNRQLLVQMLSPLGFEVQEAGDGIETLIRWQSWKPHLIFMDMRMPLKSGLEVTQQIRSREFDKGEFEKKKVRNQEELNPVSSSQLERETTQNYTNIIAVTASILEEDKAALLEAGCEGIITKPFCTSDIFDCLNQYLGVRYIYEFVKSEDDTDLDRGNHLLNPTDLASLPVNLVERLRQATIRANWCEINRISDEISLINPQISEAVKHLSASFDYATILKAIDSLGEGLGQGSPAPTGVDITSPEEI